MQCDWSHNRTAVVEVKHRLFVDWTQAVGAVNDTEQFAAATGHCKHRRSTEEFDDCSTPRRREELM